MSFRRLILSSHCFSKHRIPEEIRRAADSIRHEIGNVSIIVQNAGKFSTIIQFLIRI